MSETASTSLVQDRTGMVLGQLARPRPWDAFLTGLDLLSKSGDPVSTQLALLCRAHSRWLAEPAAVYDEIVCTDPGIRVCGPVLSPLECFYLIATSGPCLSESMVVKATGQVQTDLDTRVSETRFLHPAAMDAIESKAIAKVCAATDLAPGRAMVPNVVRYRPGGLFKAHFDWLFPTELQPNPPLRVATNIVFLNDGYSGGETAFIEPRLAVRGRPGDMLHFRNGEPATGHDKSSLHAGMPVISGEKWVLVQWERGSE